MLFVVVLDIRDLEFCLLNVNFIKFLLRCQLCHVMWVRKQGANVERQTFATLVAALHDLKSKGPSNLPQVQIECGVKNVKSQSLAMVLHSC